ncbi:SbcC/MukB-like Walker B domain-containing protein [Micromonospora sp. M12]
MAAAWAALTGWAATEADRRRADRASRAVAVDEAESVADAVQRRITGIFADADVPVGDDPVHAATVAVERADADRRRLRERREQAGRSASSGPGTSGRRRWRGRSPGTCGPTTSSGGCWPRLWICSSTARRGSCGAVLRPVRAGARQGRVRRGRPPRRGLRRGVRTLSGGETFQASLALALALSEQLAGMSTTAASLESIVLDEGFGTLDAATLDTVAATLENLAARGDRMVGVVTHVPALAERIPVRFEVRKDARSARVERTGR